MSKDAAPSFVSCYFRSEDGLRLHYREYAGPSEAPFTVICLPGLTRNARDFEDLAPHLARRYRVLSMDFRGRGSSEYAVDATTYVPMTYVRDLNALLLHAGLSRAVLIGTSLGGLVATIAGASMPQTVLGLVLNDVGPDVNPVGLARIAAYVGTIGAVDSWQDAADAVRTKDQGIYPDLTGEGWLRLARQRYVQDAAGIRLDYDPNIAKPFAAPATNPDQWPFFRQLVHVPVLLLRGSLSDILTADTVERLKTMIPTLNAAEITNRGHVPLLSEPAALTAIDAFLTQLSHTLGERMPSSVT